MIKLKQIKPQTVDVWSRTLGFLGNVNEYELNDLRIQIKKDQSSDFFVYFNKEEISILPNGYYSHWPKGFFDLQDKQLAEIYS